MIISIKSLHTQIGNFNNYLHGYSWSCLFSNHQVSGHLPVENKRISLNKLVKFIVEQICLATASHNTFELIYIVAYNGSDVFINLNNFKSISNKLKINSKCLIKTDRTIKVEYTDKSKHKKFHNCYVYDNSLLIPDKLNIFNTDITDLTIDKRWIYADGSQPHETSREINEAIRETQLSVCYFEWFKKICNESLCLEHIPATIGSLSEQIVINKWKESKHSINYILGTEEYTIQHFDEANLRLSSYETTAPNIHRDMHQKFAEESFHGGRNESLHYGITPDDIWKDWDIIGAYTTALTFLRPLKYIDAYHSQKVYDYNYQEIGFACVNFRFPEACPYPCLPVRTSRGLIFPIEGCTYATSPEIYLANRLGAQIEIIDGIIVPTDKSYDYPFMDVIKFILKKKNELYASDLESELWKQIGNSLYGKIGQGINLKRIYDPRTSTSKRITTSKISNAYFASYLTGYIRALIAEIIINIPKDKDIISITTDGFISNATDEEIINACGGELAQYFSKFRNEISSDRTVLKEKHCVASVLSWRTRGQATYKMINGSDSIILAKSGIQCNQPTKIQQNDYIIDLFKNRNKHTRCKLLHKTPLSSIIKNGGVITTINKTLRVNMDYDFKRFPQKIQEHVLDDHQYLRFKTQPMRNIKMYGYYIELITEYQKTHLNFMTSINNIKKLQSYAQAVTINKGSTKAINSINLGIEYTVKEFLKAYSNRLLGLTRKYSYNELASILTEHGYPCTEIQIKNCKRSKKPFIPNSIPKTEDNLRFVQFVKTILETFDENQFWILDQGNLPQE